MAFGPSDEEARFEGARAASAATYRNTLTARDALLGESFTTIGPASFEWQAQEERLANAADDSRQKYMALQRATDAVRISDWITIAVFVAFAVFEAPINKFMFDIVLKSNNLESYLVSLLVTGGMLGLAHIAGTQLRQLRGGFEDRIYFGKLLVAAVILLVLASCVGALTVGRASYSTAGAAADGLELFRQIGKQVQTMGPWAALLSALTDRAAVILATLNLTGIACALFLAYITHDSDMFYQAALNEAAAAHRRFARTARRYENRVGKIKRQFAPRLAAIAAAHSSQNSRVIALKRSRNAELSDDDRVDLAADDTRLREARIGIRNRAMQPHHRHVASDHAQAQQHDDGRLAQDKPGQDRFAPIRPQAQLHALFRNSAETASRDGN